MENHIYPPYHIPAEKQSILPSQLKDIIFTQNISLKKILSLYLSSVSPQNHLSENGIQIVEDSIRIHFEYFSKSEKPTKQNLQKLINNINSIIEESKNLVPEFTDAKAFYQHTIEHMNNLYSVSAEIYENLTGEKANFSELTGVLIDSVQLNIDKSVTIKVGSFLYQIRKNLINKLKNNELLKNENLIVLNIDELKKIFSNYTATLYILISQKQMFSNELIIELSEFRKLTNNKEKNKYLLRRIKESINDPALKNSTCRIIPYNINGKNNPWCVVERKEKEITKIKIRFMRNDELQEFLLELPYPFIKHLDKLNKSVLTQIIARVHDGIFDEKWINYCINKAYLIIANQSMPNSQLLTIAPLVWNFIKQKKFINEYKSKPEMCILSPTPGLAIYHTPEYNNKSKKTKKAYNTHLLNILGHDKTAYIEYINKYLPNFDCNNETANRIINHVHQHFLDKFNQTIKITIQSLGYDKNQTQIILNNLNDEIIETLFHLFKNDKIILDKSWSNILTNHFNEIIA